MLTSSVSAPRRREDIRDGVVRKVKAPSVFRNGAAWRPGLF